MPKRSNRKDMTPEELKAANKKYLKNYYLNNKKKYKPKLSVAENAIERLMRDDEYIVMLIERVGVSRIQELISENIDDDDN